MRKIFTAALAASLFATPVLAEVGCEGRTMPSPGTEINGPIHFYNDTHYAMYVKWSDFKGNLVEYGLLQPGEDLELTTYINNVWYIEIPTPDDIVCLGPVKMFETQGCIMRIIQSDDGDFGYDSGFSCDY